MAGFEISGVSPRLELPFVTQFYLFESIFRLRLDLTKDLISHMFMPAVALALPLAAIISQPETVAQGSDDARLCDARAGQGLLRDGGDPA